jgi:hypothetical protein
VLQEWRSALDVSVNALRAQLVGRDSVADPAAFSAVDGETTSRDWLQCLLDSAQELSNEMPATDEEGDAEDNQSGGGESKGHLVEHLTKLQLPLAHATIKQASCEEDRNSPGIRGRIAEMLLLLDHIRTLKIANNCASSFATRRLQHEQELRFRAQQLEKEVVPQLEQLDQTHHRESEANTVAAAAAEREGAEAAERLARENLKV